MVLPVAEELKPFNIWGTNWQLTREQRKQLRNAYRRYIKVPRKTWEPDLKAILQTHAVGYECNNFIAQGKTIFGHPRDT